MPLQRPENLHYQSFKHRGDKSHGIALANIHMAVLSRTKGKKKASALAEPSFVSSNLYAKVSNVIMASRWEFECGTVVGDKTHETFNFGNRQEIHYSEIRCQDCAGNT